MRSLLRQGEGTDRAQLNALTAFDAALIIEHHFLCKAERSLPAHITAAAAADTHFYSKINRHLD
jgi:hypothetical protein